MNLRSSRKHGEHQLSRPREGASRVAMSQPSSRGAIISHR
jgi:hypothetical protein